MHYSLENYGEKGGIIWNQAEELLVSERDRGRCTRERVVVKEKVIVIGSCKATQGQEGVGE